MKLTHYEHGTAFKETFTVQATGEIEGQPLGWGSAKHEERWLAESLRDAVAHCLARYYQCKLHGVSLAVSVRPPTR